MTFRGVWVLAGAVLVLGVVSSLEAKTTVGQIQISSPVFGSIVRPGQSLRIVLKYEDGVHPTKIGIYSSCIDDGKTTTVDPAKSGYTWEAVASARIDPTDYCDITAMAADADGNSYYALPIALTPERQIRVAALKLREAALTIPIGGTTVLDISAMQEGVGAATNVTLDKEIAVQFDDPKVARYLGEGIVEALQTGLATGTVTYSGGFPISFQIKVLPYKVAGLALTRRRLPRGTSLAAISPLIGTSMSDASGNRPSVQPMPNTGTNSQTAKGQTTLSTTLNAPKLATSGSLIWTGTPDKDGLIRIEGQQAASGALKGEFLPGTPVKITITPSDIVASQVPSASNGYQRLVLRSTHKGNMVVTIRWEVISAQ